MLVLQAHLDVVASRVPRALLVLQAHLDLADSMVPRAHLGLLALALVECHCVPTERKTAL